MVPTIDGLVEVPVPFGHFAEILDLDNRLGPHWPAFDVAPNLGLGDIVDTPQSVFPNDNGSMHISESLFDTLLNKTFGFLEQTPSNVYLSDVPMAFNSHSSHDIQ